MGWKYVMFERTMPGGTKVQFPVIFPDKMVHVEIAAVVGRVGLLDDEGEVVSAGAIDTLIVGGVGGYSSTLRIKSSPDDERTINLYNYVHGIKEN